MNAGVTAPLYLSISWVLTVSYQLLTNTAVSAVASSISFVWPAATVWLHANIQTITFVYAFTWIFVLSSVIPSAILGKERGFISQYIVVLTLSLLAFFMPDILQTFAGIDVNQVIGSLSILENPAVAIAYLSAPYLFMIAIDLRCRNAKKRKEAALLAQGNTQQIST
jgi:hypothetical protein